jgi:hypothetical protein
MKNRSFILVFYSMALVLILLHIGAKQSYAVSAVAISSSGNGVFTLKGIGIEDASAFELTVVYDTASLSNPRVAEGPLIAGAMTAVNPNVPGVVRMVIIRVSPVRGTGVIATLTFDRAGSSGGKITALTARLASAGGSLLASQVMITNPETGVAEAPASDQPLQPATNASPETPPPSPPAIIIAGQPVQPAGTGTQAQNPAPGEENAEPSDENTSSAQWDEPVMQDSSSADNALNPDLNTPAKQKRAKIYAPKSVLQLFREYSGKRNADAFLALFNQESPVGCHQDPLVALSDGIATVSVTFLSPPGNLVPSDLAVTGADLLSVTRDRNNTNTWIAKLLPHKGTYQASFAVFLGDLKIIYPLAVAPKVRIAKENSGRMTKSQFERHFSTQKPGPAPSPDLNGDGKQDYMDDFIFTANYLSAVHASP